MIQKIEHLGIAVADAEAAKEVFSRILNTSCYKEENVESEKVNTAFFKVGESKIELLSASQEQSVIAGFIAKRGEGMHHVALAVDDIYAEMERLRGLGFQFINEQPKDGADNKLIAFLHPKTTAGVLVELCQEKTAV